jgi:putative phosphoesterase
MKYLVISDLHVPERAKEIPPGILKEAKNVDGIICAGDFTTKEVFEKLKEANKNLIAVKGNCDRFSLPEYSVFFQEGRKIGVIHSHIFGRGNFLLLEEFAKSENLDIIVFGHTHFPFLEKRGNILMINPGSLTGIGSGHGAPSEKTYAILEVIAGLEPHAEIRKIA